jgi:hypothetical protein
MTLRLCCVGDRRVRRVVGIVVVALVAAGSGDLPSDAPGQRPMNLLIHESPSPFQRVSAGPVTATIPDAWHPELAGSRSDPRRGIVAGPRPGAWHADRPPVEGLAAMWVDGSEVGVPSDYYYLAATRTAFDLITGSKRCTATHHRVIVDHVPTYAHGDPDSPGDFVARGNGTCEVRDQPTRWAYFVAAPGYGPVREVGIPSSGLYVVVVVRPGSPEGALPLGRLLERTQFNGDSIPEMIAAARPSSLRVIVKI